jgi:hypothetical protein
LESWRNRRVDRIGLLLLQETASFINQRMSLLNSAT